MQNAKTTILRILHLIYTQNCSIFITVNSVDKNRLQKTQPPRFSLSKKSRVDKIDIVDKWQFHNIIFSPNCQCFFTIYFGEVGNIYELFRAEIAKQKRLRHLTNEDIAKMTGYKNSTIMAFMCGARSTEKVAKAIAKVLQIEL